MGLMIDLCIAELNLSLLSRMFRVLIFPIHRWLDPKRIKGRYLGFVFSQVGNVTGTFSM